MNQQPLTLIVHLTGLPTFLLLINSADAIRLKERILHRKVVGNKQHNRIDSDFSAKPLAIFPMKELVDLRLHLV